MKYEVDANDWCARSDDSEGSGSMLVRGGYESLRKVEGWNDECSDIRAVVGYWGGDSHGLPKL